MLEDANIKLAGVASDACWGISGRDDRGDDPRRGQPGRAGGSGESGCGASCRIAACGKGGPRSPPVPAEVADGPGPIPPLKTRSRYTAPDRGHGPFRRRGGAVADDPGRRPGRGGDRSGDRVGRQAEFPTAGHLSAWSGLCPGKRETWPTKGSGRTTNGSQWLRTLLVRVAWAAGRTDGTVFQKQYRRWCRRMGRKKAIVAVAHKVLTIIYSVLKKHGD